MRLRIISREEGVYTYEINDGGGADFFRFPFVKPEAYYLRRIVADKDGDVVVGVDIGWEDAAAGPAGSDIDHAALAVDTVAEQVEARRTHTDMAGHGARLLTGTAQQDLIANEGELVLSCPIANACTVTFESNATTVTGQVVSSVVDINHHESFDSLPIENVRLDYLGEDDNVTFRDRDGRNYLSHLDARNTVSESGYRKVVVINSDNNNLKVEVQLDPSYRGDYEMVGFQEHSLDPQPVRAFGVVPFTRPNLGDLPPYPQDYRGTGTTVSYDHAGVHMGYRQPRVDDPWFEQTGALKYFENLESGRKRELYQVDEHNPGLANGNEYVPDFYRIRWPVNFEDMNWVLYELPGDVADLDTTVSAFWHRTESRKALAGSAYSQTHMPYGTFYDEIICGYSEFGDAGEDENNLEASAAVNTAGCEPNETLETLIQGEIDNSKGRGMYPFWTQDPYLAGGVGGAPPQPLDGVPGIQGRMGLDMMTYYLAKNKVLDRSRFVPGALEGDNPPEEGVLIAIEDWAIAVRAGVAAPEGQDRVRKRGLTDFPIKVLEQSGPLGEGGELGEVKIGVPADPRMRNRFIEAIPNRPIDPNHAHLMVITFYQSAPVETSEFQPTQEEAEVGYVFKSTVVAGKLTRRQRIAAVKEQCIVNNPMNQQPCIDASAQAHEDLTDYREKGGGSNFSPYDQPDYPVDSSAVVKIPKRNVRRVICRIYIGSAGHTEIDWGVAGKIVDFFNDSKDTISGLYSAIVNWYAAMTTTLGEGPIRLGEESISVVCDGTSAVEQVTSDEVAELDRSTVDKNGVVVESDAGNARQDHIALCERLTIPDDVRCASASDALLEDGRCVNLPQMALQYSENVGEFKFLNFTEILPKTKINVGYPRPPNDLGVPTPETYTPGFSAFNEKASSLRAKGLTRVKVDFDFAWPNGVDKLYDSVKGYMVMVKPDPKVFGANGSYWRHFLLPSVVVERQLVPGDLVATRTPHRVEGFWFGTLNASPGEYVGAARYVNDPFAAINVLSVVGPPKVKVDLREFQTLLKQLPGCPRLSAPVQDHPVPRHPGAGRMGTGPSGLQYIRGGR